jgi:hypothetical protein
MKGLMAVGAVALGLMLAGCGGGIPGTSGEVAEGQPQGPGGTVRNFLLYGQATVPPSQAPTVDARTYGCPELGVLEGAAAWRGSGPATGATGVAYQASLGNLARECTVSGTQMLIRVGVEGRLLLGSAGRPGAYSVPVRVVVKRRNDIVTQRFTRLNVTVPANDTQAEFVHIEENIALPISENDPAEEFDLYVGFDPTGQAARDQRRRAR